jgi:hypothetical protein
MLGGGYDLRLRAELRRSVAGAKGVAYPCLWRKGRGGRRVKVLALSCQVSISKSSTTNELEVTSALSHSFARAILR